MDEKKLDELYKEYASDIYHYLLHLSGSTEKAADLLQETFLRIFRYFDSQKRVQKQKSYFFKIAYNLFLSSIHKDKKNSNIDIEKIEISTQTDNFSHKVHFQMLKEAIIKKLEHEGEVYSQIFLLRVDHEMTLKEMANCAK